MNYDFGSSFNPNSFMDYSYEPDYSSFDMGPSEDYSFDPFMDYNDSSMMGPALAGVGGASVIGRNLPVGGVNPAVSGRVNPGTLNNVSNIIGRNLPTGGVNPAVSGRVDPRTLKDVFNVIGRNLPTGGVNPEVSGRVYQNRLRPKPIPAPNPNVFSRGIQGAGKLFGSALSYLIPDQAADSTIRGAIEDARANGIPEGELLQTYGAAVMSQYPAFEPLENFTPDGSIPSYYLDPQNNQQSLFKDFSDYIGATELGENVGQYLGESKYGTGIGAGGNLTGQPFNPNTLLGQTSTLGASGLEFMDFINRQGNAAIGAGTNLAGRGAEYFTGMDFIPGGPVDSQAVQQAQGRSAGQSIPKGQPGSPQAFFEEYRSRGPLTPEQIAMGEAEAARMGTTFDPDMGFSRDAFLSGTPAPQQQIAPMGVDETRARLGGRTLNEYLNAPAGTPGVYGVRTDPQGRMIPTIDDSQSIVEPSEYEKASAERYARMEERERRPGESRTERDTRLAQGETQRTMYGGYSEPQLRDLFGDQNLRQAKAKLSAGVDPVTNKRITDERRKEYDAALKTQILEERLVGYREEDPDKFEKARVLVGKMIQAGQIQREEGREYMLRALNLDDKKFNDTDESELMGMIRAAGVEPEGNVGGSTKGTVRMIDRSGRERDVPEHQVEQALKNQYTRA